MIRENRWLLLALLLISALGAAITSCGGGGGGSSDGELCQQCGDTDGPCQRIAFVIPGANEPEVCPTAPTTSATCVPRTLICRRKSDSSQQRCYPGDPIGSDVDFSFRCDGSRPGGTARPEPVTPTPATPVPTPTKTPDPNAICGDGVIEGIEECDGINLDGNSCADFCADDTGTLSCSGCTFNFIGCLGGNCSR
jgi:hypothetical protein